MKSLLNKARIILCIIIVAGFFLPAYQKISGFGFIDFAFNAAKQHGEITTTDVYIVILPLLLVPFSALVILLRSLLYIRTKKVYTLLPLFFLFVFLSLVFISARSNSANFSRPHALLQMGAGFYLTLISSFLLVFTRGHRRRKKKRVTRVEPGVAVQTS